MNGPILIVDDDLDMHFFYKKVIEKIRASAKLLFFENGKDALHFLKKPETNPHIIFSDIDMPLMNGLELLTAINADPSIKSKNIPFIFFSTSARQKEVKYAYELCVQGFFNKGMTLEILEKNVSLALSYWDACRLPHPETCHLL